MYEISSDTVTDLRERCRSLLKQVEAQIERIEMGELHRLRSQAGQLRGILDKIGWLESY